MSKNKYEPQSVSEIIFSNVESRQLIVDIVSGAVPFPNAGTTGILLYGIYGTGKTTLAKELVGILSKHGVTWLNADEVRKNANDWDFSTAGRIRQAQRMGHLAQIGRAHV